MRWRRPRGEDETGDDAERPFDDRAFSARTSIPPGGAGTDLVGDTALPAETGPIWAPDELSIWPVEGGRYGLDAHYHGVTGTRRARHQQQRLDAVHLAASVRRNDRGGSTLRLGPLQHRAAWLALEAFLGRPIEAGDQPPGEPGPAPRLDAEG